MKFYKFRKRGLWHKIIEEGLSFGNRSLKRTVCDQLLFVKLDGTYLVSDAEPSDNVCQHCKKNIPICGASL